MIRLQEDDKYPNTQKTCGWTEEICRYLDYLTTIDISHSTLASEALILVCNDDDRQAGPMRARKDFKVHHANYHLSSTRTRTTPSSHDHSMKHCEQTRNGGAQNGKPIGRKLPLHHPHNNGGNTNTKTLNDANTETLNGEITIGARVMATDSFKVTWEFFHRFRVQTLANVVHATGCEARTPRRTHIFSQCCRCRAPLTFRRTCVWLRMSQGCVAPLAHSKFIHSQHVSSTTLRCA